MYNEYRRKKLPEKIPAEKVPGTFSKHRDYEYERNGTRNIFVTVEPKGGHREVVVTKKRKIGIFSRQSIRGRIGTEEKLREHATIWQKGRNQEGALITWKFTTKDARVKFKYGDGSELN